MYIKQQHITVSVQSYAIKVRNIYYQPVWERKGEARRIVINTAIGK